MDDMLIEISLGNVMMSYVFIARYRGQCLICSCLIYEVQLASGAKQVELACAHIMHLMDMF